MSQKNSSNNIFYLLLSCFYTNFPHCFFIIHFLSFLSSVSPVLFQTFLCSTCRKMLYKNIAKTKKDFSDILLFYGSCSSSLTTRNVQKVSKFFFIWKNNSIRIASWNRNDKIKVNSRFYILVVVSSNFERFVTSLISYHLSIVSMLWTRSKGLFLNKLISYHVITLTSMIIQKKQIVMKYKRSNKIVEAALLRDVMDNVKYMMEHLVVRGHSLTMEFQGRWLDQHEKSQ